jgi:hypothetical protein
MITAIAITPKALLRVSVTLIWPLSKFTPPTRIPEISSTKTINLEVLPNSSPNEALYSNGGWVGWSSREGSHSLAAIPKNFEVELTALKVDDTHVPPAVVSGVSASSGDGGVAIAVSPCYL